MFESEDIRIGTLIAVVSSSPYYGIVIGRSDPALGEKEPGVLVWWFCDRKVGDQSWGFVGSQCYEIKVENE